MSVTAAQGFRAAGATAGLKASGRSDVAVLVNDGPAASAAAVFTTNRVAAAPVRWSRGVLADGSVRAVVLNSGGANAATGAAGEADSRATAEHAADLLGLEPADVTVCSTGLIGQRLDMPRLRTGVAAAVEALSVQGGADAAEAIMTTDTVPKQALVQGEGYTVGGMAKGAGMLAPGMATMLCVVTTDAVLESERLQDALTEAVRTTFNRTDSDGCMSTNDTVLLLSSGASGVEADPAEFTEQLRAVCSDLARQLITDAEGARHDVAVRVVGAQTEEAAEAVARAVTRSNLFKTAVFGEDPNWGRVVSAVGTVPASVAAFDADALDVWFNGVQVCRACGVGEPRESVDLSGRQVDVVVDLHAGDAEATVWTNDLTHEYVHENSAYSS